MSWSPVNELIIVFIFDNKTQLISFGSQCNHDNLRILIHLEGALRWLGIKPISKVLPKLANDSSVLANSKHIPVPSIALLVHHINGNCAGGDLWAGPWAPAIEDDV